jgi:hypothetical protein
MVNVTVVKATSLTNGLVARTYRATGCCVVSVETLPIPALDRMELCTAERDDSTPPVEVIDEESLITIASITGPVRSGKSTLANLISDILGFGKNTFEAGLGVQVRVVQACFGVLLLIFLASRIVQPKYGFTNGTMRSPPSIPIAQLALCGCTTPLGWVRLILIEWCRFSLMGALMLFQKETTGAPLFQILPTSLSECFLFSGLLIS